MDGAEPAVGIAEVVMLLAGMLVGRVALPTPRNTRMKYARFCVFYVATFLPSLVVTTYYWSAADWLAPNPAPTHWLACAMLGLWLQELWLPWRVKGVVDVGIIVHHALVALMLMELIYKRHVLLYCYFWVLLIGGFFDFLGNVTVFIPDKYRVPHKVLFYLVFLIGRVYMPTRNYWQYFYVFSGIWSFHIMLILNFVVILYIFYYGLEKSFCVVAEEN